MASKVCSTPLLTLQNASLYVGDLQPQVSEPTLVQLFTRALVPVKSARVCRDCVTGKSLGYAYVNFFCHSDAYKALISMNHTYLYGKPIRIMWLQRDPFVRKTGTGNLFVKNLDQCIDSVMLECSFRKFGTVLSCKVAEENGISKGFGFVQFASEESAMRALKDLDGTILAGKKISVLKFLRKSERQPVSKEVTLANLYVKNLDKDVTEDLLRNKFSELGKVSSVAIMKDGEGISKSFGFVCFESLEDESKVITSMNGAELGSKKIFVAKAQKKAERQQVLKNLHCTVHDTILENFKDSNVYVKNLNESIDDLKLRDIFYTCGKIVSAKVMHYQNGTSKGFGFVCFSNPDEANKAVSTLNRTMLLGKPLYVAIAQHKTYRLATLQNYSAQPRRLYSSLCGLYGQPGYRSISAYPLNVNPGYANTCIGVTKSMVCSSETRSNQKNGPRTVSKIQTQLKTVNWVNNLPMVSQPHPESLKQFSMNVDCVRSNILPGFTKKGGEKFTCEATSSKGSQWISSIAAAAKLTAATTAKDYKQMTVDTCHSNSSNNN